VETRGTVALRTLVKVLDVLLNAVLGYHRRIHYVIACSRRGGSLLGYGLGGSRRKVALLDHGLGRHSCALLDDGRSRGSSRKNGRWRSINHRLFGQSRIDGAWWFFDH
jgi:hypothetical protein